MKMRFKNTSSSAVNLPSFGLVVEPGAEVEVEEDMFKPGKKDNGARRLSPIESLAPQLVPCDDNDAEVMEVFSGQKQATAPQARKVEEDPRVPPGVAELKRRKREKE